jgi:TonB-dependent receptor
MKAKAKRLRRVGLMQCGVSILALMASSAAFAQEAAVETVVVTGMRASLKSAQSIKQNADTVVDSITAVDIGAMPDKSVAEALKRVPGVTVGLFASSGDTSHFSAEPSTVLVRGLQQVRSEFNGRDTFSVDAFRGLSWGDISPELMAGIDTYKNQMADMIEGGLAGSINLRTRVPFDSDGQLVSITGKLNYGSLAQKITPDLSGIYSTRIPTKYGEFGIMVNAAYSMVKTRSEGSEVGRIFQETNPAAFTGANTPDGKAWVISGADITDSMFTRERVGASGALQWQNNSRTLVTTLQYNISRHRDQINEYSSRVKLSGDPNTDPEKQSVPSTGPQLPDGGENDWILPLTGSSFTFDKNGMFTSGTPMGKVSWEGQNISWTDANNANHNFFNYCYSWALGQSWSNCAANDTRYRLQPTIDNKTRYWDDRSTTADLALNVKYDPTDRLHINADAQWVHATKYNWDNTLDLSTSQFINFKLSGNGITWTDAGTGGAGTGQGYGMDLKPGGWNNLGNYYAPFAMDHLEEDKGNEFAYRADAQYDLQTTWFDSIKAGFRFADRNQHIQDSGYNWNTVCATWSGDCSNANFLANTFNSRYVESHNFGSDFLDGSTMPATNIWYASMNTTKSKDASWSFASANSTGHGTWHQVCERPDELANSCFRQTDLVQVSERTVAGYLMLKFGGANASVFDGFMGVSGNIGVRVVNTTVSSSGAIQFPQMATSSWTGCDQTKPDCHERGVDPLTLVSADDRAFSNNAGTLQSARYSYTHVLPSFNLKLDLPSDWVVRFAASRAMSRPELGYLRNSAQFGNMNVPSGAYQPGDKVTIHYTATAGNPGLKPMYADMLDISLERYFSSVGNFSVDGFYKKFHDYFRYANFDRDFTNNGVTRTATVSGPFNAKGGEIYGVEGAFTRYMDFLPDPFDGFGVQLNFVALHNAGLVTANISAGDPGSHYNGWSHLPLEGLSDLSGNLVGMYEKGPIALRLAYDWRSKYMVTAADAVVKTAVFARSRGQLDGSIRYSFDDNWEVSLQGSNILGNMVKLQQQVNGDPRILMPRSWFETDRRFEASIRMKY